MRCSEAFAEMAQVFPEGYVQDCSWCRMVELPHV